MKQIPMRENPTGLQVFVDGEPKTAELSSDELLVLGVSLGLVVTQQIEYYQKRKGEYQKKKATSQ